jgi:glutamate N-acetyltransferase/amino-acid N-acetyltransferase
MKIISRGIYLPLGFSANGIACGIKRSGKKDLALIYSEVPAKAVGMFTSNRFRSHAIKVSRLHLKDRKAQAIIINSGNANCANGKAGFGAALKMCHFTAKGLGIRDTDVLVASTGIIGRPLEIKRIKDALPRLIQGLSRAHSRDAALAIMTTDTKPKQLAVKIKIAGKSVTIAAMAKGAGMIYPSLSAQGHATMLAFINTDARISYPALRLALENAVGNSFNCISVDGCMSTNDSVFILANGLARNRILKSRGKDFLRFQEALDFVCLGLAREIIKDAEGASKFIKITVTGAGSYSDAKKIADRIANSNLVKTAAYGGSSNWGRIISAVGSSNVSFRPEKLKIKFSSFKKSLIDININLNMGKCRAVVYTCDLSVKYVRINAGYN